MKFPSFDYACPASVSEAVALLAAAGGAAKPIAGGQSLLPAMAFRLAAPLLLVDLRRIPDLDHILIDEHGVRLGAKVRWRDIEADARVSRAHPLLAEAIRHVAHYQIRNRGTVGGSLAHADPAAEMPGIAVACDAEVTLIGAKGKRTLPSQQFFLGPLTTALEPDELIVEVRLPPWKHQRRWAFEEFARRRGDFAMAGVAVFFDLDSAARATNAHVAVIGACQRPHRVAQAESVINGRAVDAQVALAAAEAFSSALEPPGDLHASAEYRRALAATLLERALVRAAGR